MFSNKIFIVLLVAVMALASSSNNFVKAEIENRAAMGAGNHIQQMGLKRLNKRDSIFERAESSSSSASDDKKSSSKDDKKTSSAKHHSKTKSSSKTATATSTGALATSNSESGSLLPTSSSLNSSIGALSPTTSGKSNSASSVEFKGVTSALILALGMGVGFSLI